MKYSFFLGLAPAILLPILLDTPAVLGRDAVQSLLRTFYDFFDSGIEKSLNAVAFGDSARLIFAIEWTLMPFQVLFFLMWFARVDRSGFSRLAAWPFWKSFVLMNVVGLVSLAVYAQPIFDPPAATAQTVEGIGTHLLRLGYSGKFQFLLMFSAMSWGLALMVAGFLGYWGWVVYPKLCGGRNV